MFGEDVQLNFKGEDSYKTPIGAIMTVFFWIMILYYSFDQTVHQLNYTILG